MTAHLNVVCNADGTLTITADANTAATLAGREGFGYLSATQAQLREHIADAWHEAGCPR